MDKWMVSFSCSESEGGIFCDGQMELVVVLSALCVQGVKQMDLPIPAGYVMCPIHRNHMAVCQNLVPLVNIKIAGKWMFIPLKMVLIGIDS